MKTKSLIILSLFLFTYHLASAQKSIRSKRVGITFSSLGESEPIHFANLDGAGSYSGKNFYTFGVNYIHPLNSWLDIETGVEYARHTIKVDQGMPPMNTPSYESNLSLINLPLTVRANFSNYFFVNGGLLLGFESSSSGIVDNQSGVGALLGVGAQYEFNNGFGLFINPYLKAHSLIHFSSDKYHQRLMEYGVRVGVTHSF